MAQDLPFAPLADNAPQHPALGVMPTSGKLIPRTNYADRVNEDPMLKEQVYNGLYPLMTDLRSRRRSLESEWQAIRRMDLMLHDEGRRYVGRSNAYLPVWAKAKNTKVSTLTRGLFPNDEYMDCFDRGIGDTEAAKALKSWMKYQFESVARVRKLIKPFLRQYTGFGNSVLKVGWRTPDEVRQMRGKRSIAGALFAPEPAYPSGLYVSVRDVFNVYVFPETAETDRDILFQMEDVLVPTSYIERMKSLGKWVNTDAAIASTDVEAAKRQVALSDSSGIPDVLYFQQNKIGELRVLTEIWTYMVLPRDAYIPGEDPDLPVPVRCVLPNQGNIPLLIERSPYFHQCFPYLWARQMTEPGLWYGQGDGRLVRGMQYLSNDFANQTNDVGVYTLNPIIKQNPGMMIGTQTPLRPGAVYNMTNVKEGMEFDRPPFELVQMGMQMLGMYSGMVGDYAGAPPVLQGTGAGKGARTATGAQILQKNALSPIQDQVEDLEQDVTVPMMYLAWKLGVQYVDMPTVVKMAGQAVQKIDPSLFQREDLDPEFTWTGSSQAQNQAQRAQAITQFLQVIMPMVMYLNQLGYIFDPMPLIRRFYNDGLGLRNFDECIKPAAAGPMPASAPPVQPGAAGPGMNPAQATPAGTEQMDRIRSALEQLQGGGAENPMDMAPGEGEDFMDVRKQADEMAAQFGGLQ